MKWEDIVARLREVEPELFRVYVAWEEHYWPFRDRHGRFLARYSRRVVYECEVSESLISRGLLNIEWPERAPFAVVLTHDIDFPRMGKTYALATALKALHYGKFSESIKRVVGVFSKSLDPFVNYRMIMDIESRFNAKSTFFFLVDDKLNEMADEIGSIVDRGWEVGLHTGYFSYDDPLKISNEKSTLEKISGIRVKGVRNHFLRFSTPRTWEILSQFFEYDSTYGYADHVGFRNGMCHPFKPSTLDGKTISIWEIPLTVMDTTFYKYMDADVREAFEWVKLLAEKVRKVNGVITILWHNTTFDELMYGEYAKLYRTLLRFFREQKAWLTSCGELYDYWVKHYG